MITFVLYTQNVLKSRKRWRPFLKSVADLLIDMKVNDHAAGSDVTGRHAGWPTHLSWKDEVMHLSLSVSLAALSLSLC